MNKKLKVLIEIAILCMLALATLYSFLWASLVGFRSLHLGDFEFISATPPLTELSWEQGVAIAVSIVSLASFIFAFLYVICDWWNMIK